MGLHLADQHTLTRMLFAAYDFDERPALRQHTRNTCIVAIAQERAGNQISASVGKILPAQRDNELVVIVDYTPKPPTSLPGPNAEFLEHGNRCVYLEENTICFHDKFAVPADPIYWELLKKNGFQSSTLQVWNHRTRRHCNFLQRKCDRLPREFKIIVGSPLNSWNISMKRLVRVPPTEEWPNGISGLLKSIR